MLAHRRANNYTSGANTQTENVRSGEDRIFPENARQLFDFRRIFGRLIEANAATQMINFTISKLQTETNAVNITFRRILSRRGNEQKKIRLITARSGFHLCVCTDFINRI